MPNKEKPMPKYVVLKLQNTKDKEILEQPQKKDKSICTQKS